jgi:hypothetical protein
MMVVDLFGKPENITKKEVMYAAKFFAECMTGPRLSKNLDLMITFAKMKGDVEGYCFPVDDFERHGPRTFEIEIDKTMGRKDVLRVLAHEIVHVKQYARKELKRLDGDVASWNGKTMRVTGDYIQYLFLPWEIEAFGTERALVVAYLTHLKQQKISFDKKKA